MPTEDKLKHLRNNTEHLCSLAKAKLTSSPELLLTAVKKPKKSRLAQIGYIFDL
jgi:hypothetical protein